MSELRPNLSMLLIFRYCFKKIICIFAMLVILIILTVILLLLFHHMDYDQLFVCICPAIGYIL